MIGDVLGHYRIVSKIGEGGMGLVYRARDEFLHRDVALKVLGKGPAVGQQTKEHLLHEARSSSALSHPNICTIHEVGEIDGDLYIVMELVEGKTLSSLIAGESKPLKRPHLQRAAIAPESARATRRIRPPGGISSFRITVRVSR